MSLRKSIISNVISRLEYHDFCKDDFVVDFPNPSASVLVYIKFRADQNYYFTISETYEHGGFFGTINKLNGDSKLKLETTESPGEYKNLQNKINDSMSSCIDRIPGWTQRIKEELRSKRHDFEYDVDEFIESFHKKIDESIEDKDSYFSDEEQLDLEDKLDQLKARVDELEKKYELSQSKVESVKEAIEKTKSDIAIYPKSVWYKTAGNKIINALKVAVKNKDVREILLEVTKKFLL